MGGLGAVERLTSYHTLPQMGPPEGSWEYPGADLSW